MLVTVAICTWNRAESLRETLNQMLSLRIPANVDWELLVVDNNCTDHTQTVLSEFTSRLPLKVLFEERAGQSHARNCAIQAARGELVLWTDDDVHVEPDWISSYVEAASQYPDFSFFGGTVVPRFESSPPPWIETRINLLSEVYALAEYGREVRPLGPEPIVGANMAFRRDVLSAHEFDPNLGLSRDGAVRGDETDFLERLREAGSKGLWVGTAAVHHFIPSSRMTSDYVWSWYVGKGQAYWRRHPEIGSGTTRIFGVPRWLLKKFITARLGTLWHSVCGNQDRWFESFRNAATLRGFLTESSQPHRLNASLSASA